MPHGKLDVLLVSAKALEDTDFLGNMDPYVVITCRTQEKKSSVASGKGSNPEWNENFTFTITNDVEELRMKIMDSDSGTADDFVGEVNIPLETLFIERSIPLASYNVVKEDKYCGEIRVGLTFTPAESRHRGFDTREEGRHHGFGAREESYGGWKESAYTD